jgi:hypothetical protein
MTPCFGLKHLLGAGGAHPDKPALKLRAAGAIPPFFSGIMQDRKIKQEGSLRNWKHVNESMHKEPSAHQALPEPGV